MAPRHVYKYRVCKLENLDVSFTTTTNNIQYASVVATDLRLGPAMGAQSVLGGSVDLRR